MSSKMISDRAKIFIQHIKNGVIKKEILPNTSPNYTEWQEEEDTEFFNGFFLHSAFFEEIDEWAKVRYYGE